MAYDKGLDTAPAKSSGGSRAPHQDFQWSDVGNWYHQAANWWNKKNAPQIGQNPYLGNYGGLISQLQTQAAGGGPSLAGNAYVQAHNQGIHDQMSMAAGGSAGQVRQAGQNVGRMSQSLAGGYSNARLQEQLAAQQALQGALSGASNAWFMPQAANLQATMNTQTNGQQLLGFLSQLGGGLGKIT